METNVVDRRSEQVISPWVTLVTHSLQLPDWKKSEDYHSLQQADYVALFTVTAEGRIPLVRQYRSALGCYTLELPSGLLEKGEDPKETGVRELFEETGFVAGPEVQLMGRLAADTGRLENYQWAFFTNGATRRPDQTWVAEAQVENLLVTKDELKQLILKGEFNHCPHLAVIALALVRGLFSF